MKPDPSRDESAVPLWSGLRPIRVPPDCFADETAIDFPSVAGLVDRVREGLLPEAERERSSLVQTDVSLSHDEAHRGTIIPLEVQMRGTCILCGGRGETWSDPCEECDGTGNSVVRRAVRALIPPGVFDGACVRFRLSAPSAPPVRVEIRVAIRVS